LFILYEWTSISDKLQGPGFTARYESKLSFVSSIRHLCSEVPISVLETSFWALPSGILLHLKSFFIGLSKAHFFRFYFIPWKFLISWYSRKTSNRKHIVLCACALPVGIPFLWTCSVFQLSIHRTTSRSILWSPISYNNLAFVKRFAKVLFYRLCSSEFNLNFHLYVTMWVDFICLYEQKQKVLIYF